MQRQLESISCLFRPCFWRYSGLRRLADQAFALLSRLQMIASLPQTSSCKTLLARLHDSRITMAKSFYLISGPRGALDAKGKSPGLRNFQKIYDAKGFAVVGISLDDGGWKVLKPFLSGTQIPYRILLGDDATAQRYGITNLPDTFLIDRQGRVAAVYTGLVDKDEVEANVRTMLSEH